MLKDIRWPIFYRGYCFHSFPPGLRDIWNGWNALIGFVIMYHNYGYPKTLVLSYDNNVMSCNDLKMVLSGNLVTFHIS